MSNVTIETEKAADRPREHCGSAARGAASQHFPIHARGLAPREGGLSQPSPAPPFVPAIIAEPASRGTGSMSGDSTTGAARI